jgi:hypothetical protein
MSFLYFVIKVVVDIWYDSEKQQAYIKNQLESHSFIKRFKYEIEKASNLNDENDVSDTDGEDYGNSNDDEYYYNDDEDEKETFDPKHFKVELENKNSSSSSNLNGNENHEE